VVVALEMVEGETATNVTVSLGTSAVIEYFVLLLLLLIPLLDSELVVLLW
jgi:hypothetical protein